MIPYYFYGLSGPSDRQLNINYFRDVAFPLAITNHIAFWCLVLGVPACHRAKLANVRHSSEVEYYQTSTLRLLRQHHSRVPDDVSDEAIVACIYRANFEMAPGFGSPGHATIHMRHAANIIRRRGGPKSLRTNPRLTIAVNIFDYVALDFAG